MSLPKHSYPFGNEGGQKTPSEEDLLAYLEGTLDAEATRKIELQLQEDDTLSDALDGLTAMGQEDAIKTNKRIQRQLASLLDDNKEMRRGLQNLNWIWMAVIIVLLLAVAAFCVLYLMAKKP